MEDRRETFIKKWFERALSEKDPFDKFFCLWLAIIIAAQKTLTYFDRSDSPATDRDKLVEYFRFKKNEILKIIDSRKEIMKSLCSRQGSRYRNPIIDTGNCELKKKFQKLAECHTKNTPLDDKIHVEYFAELLNKVRNNVFHGVKIYDERNDVELLNLINPLLEEILKKCEEL
ncbi:MAG: hypothetical protein HY606_15600 [Planctomycetes bacterium]|nr:hypothetical protein [Planctomycetota bacterium]